MPVAYGLETFKDRVNERDEVLKALYDQRIRVVTIVGRRGIGKSALAARVAAHVEDSDASSRVVNVSSRTNGLSLERIYHDCARSLGGAEEDALVSAWPSSRTSAEKVMLLLTAFADVRCLLVLDNLEDRLTDTGRVGDDQLRAFFEVIFRARHAMQVLVTTQVPVALGPAVRRYERRIYLDAGLPPEEGVALLRDLDGDGDAGLHRVSDSELASAVRRVHGVPRAIELVFGALVEDYLTLPTLHDVLDNYAARGDMVANLAQDRFRRLDEATRLVLDALAVFGRPTTTAAVDWVLRPMTPELDVTAALARLAARGRMVTFDRSTRTFALHPMDTDLVFSELESDGPMGSRSLDRRVADWYARNRVPASRWRTVDDAQAHRYEFTHRVRAGDFEAAAQVLGEVDEFLVWRGSGTAAATMHEQVDDRLQDAEIDLAHLVGHGVSMLAIGPLDGARRQLERAVALAEKVGNDRLTQRANFALGDVYRSIGRLDLTIEPLRKASTLAEQIGDVELLCRTLMSLSLAHSYRREIPQAQQIVERMRAVAEQCDYEAGMAQAYDAAACVALAAGRWAQVIVAAEQAVLCYQRAGITEALGFVSNVRGVAFLGLGNRDEAESSFVRGLDFGEEVHSPRAVGLCLYNLGWLHWTNREYDRATDVLRNAAEALGRSGGADFAAASALCEAAAAMADGNVVDAARGLLTAAGKSIGNADFVPAVWLAEEARVVAAGAGAEDLVARAQEVLDG